MKVQILRVSKAKKWSMRQGLVLPGNLAKTGGYEVVGKCYLHGYMGAEVLLGPVPRPYERAYKSVEVIQICEKVFKNFRDWRSS
jgi:hypothetical protein